MEGLKPDPKNPRAIDEVALKELGRYQRQYGDLSGIVFNVRSGQLVGAHQRIKNIPKNSQIDWDENKKAPEDERFGTIRAGGNIWTIRAVSWPLDKQRAANIIANNPALQGMFETDLLADALTEVNYEDVGFNTMDMEVAGFSDEQLDSILGRPGVTTENNSPEVDSAIAEMAQMGQDGREGNKQRKAEKDAEDEQKLTGIPGEFMDSIGSKIRSMKSRQQEETNYYRIALFRDEEQAARFMEGLGLPIEQRYFDGMDIMKRLDIAQEQELEEAPSDAQKETAKESQAQKLGRSSNKTPKRSRGKREDHQGN